MKQLKIFFEKIKILNRNENIFKNYTKIKAEKNIKKKMNQIS